MNHKLLCFLEWVIYDNCNLNCSYCVNRGEYSQKTRDKMLYLPGRERDIARQFVKISKEFKRTIVNLTGGEPTAAKYFGDVLNILKENSNIEVRLITNLKNSNWVEEHGGNLSRILVSLHAKYRDDAEIDKIIAAINVAKKRTTVTMSQVDFELSPEDRAKLARIEAATGLTVDYQTFIPPWTDDGKVDNAENIMDTNFQSSRGKRCSLGFNYFFVYPDGTFKYDLWCNEATEKRGHLINDNFIDNRKYILEDMKKCPYSSCGCNCNYFCHAEYLEECRLNGYPANEIFYGKNVRLKQRLLRKLTALRVRFSK